MINQDSKDMSSRHSPFLDDKEPEDDHFEDNYGAVEESQDQSSSVIDNFEDENDSATGHTCVHKASSPIDSTEINANKLKN